MKLGTETGSLATHVQMNYQQPTPEVGMGATMCSWSDRNPGTIVSVSKSGKQVWVQSDKYERTDSHGMSESQDYTYTRNPEGGKDKFSLRKDGRWRQVGGGGMGLLIGTRERYFDYSF